MRRNEEPMRVRPYELLCMVCAQGGGEPGAPAPRLSERLAAIRRDPDAPMALCCRAGNQFAWQDPGCADDTPEGAAFNQRRDMVTLMRMDLAPGAVLPARVALARLVKAIPSLDGVCGGANESVKWRGCPRAELGFYEKGRERGIEAIIPSRDDAEMASDKEKSLSDMLSEGAIRVRPHILVCAVAQYGNGVRPPYPPDNLPEMIEHILEYPETPIELEHGSGWMMCGSCPYRVADRDACVCGGIWSGGLYNEMKDMSFLRAVGLDFGDRVPAREMYRLIFERIEETKGVCALPEEIAELSVWRDGCGRNSDPCPGYRKGREELMGKLCGAGLPSGSAANSESGK